MTQTQLMTRFLDGIPPGTTLRSGLLRATHNRLWWMPDTAKFGRSLALRNGTSMLLIYDNAVKGSRTFARDREDWLTRECERRGIPFAEFRANQLDKSHAPMTTILKGMGIITNQEFDPCSFHLLMGAILDQRVFCYEKPAGWLIDRWWKFYTTSCSLCNLESLFPSAWELWDWYNKAQQLL
jgi:hypothetical protein